MAKTIRRQQNSKKVAVAGRKGKALRRHSGTAVSDPQFDTDEDLNNFVDHMVVAAANTGDDPVKSIMMAHKWFSHKLKMRDQKIGEAKLAFAVEKFRATSLVLAG